MPRDAPVTIATLLDSFTIFFLPNIAACPRLMGGSYALSISG
jgi:hypothetical protein